MHLFDSYLLSVTMDYIAIPAYDCDNVELHFSFCRQKITYEEDGKNAAACIFFYSFDLYI